MADLVKVESAFRFAYLGCSNPDSCLDYLFLVALCPDCSNLVVRRLVGLCCFVRNCLLAVFALSWIAADTKSPSVTGRR